MLVSVQSAENAPFPLGTSIARGKTFLKYVVTPLAATGLLALCAHISFPLPLTPIPVTMQTFGVLLIGLLLDPVVAVSTTLLYLVEGAIGLPVFAPHGLGGLLQLSGPSAGYLLSYPFATLITGRLFSAVRRSLPPFVASTVACAVAGTFVLLCGCIWLGALVHASPSHALVLGMFPFLTGEAFKVMLLACIVAAVHPSKQTR